MLNKRKRNRIKKPANKFKYYEYSSKYGRITATAIMLRMLELKKDINYGN